MTAGHIPNHELEEYYPAYFEKLVKFIGQANIKEGATYADIGLKNAKMEYIKSRLNIEVDQVAGKDFNYLFQEKPYDVIFCLETLEHIANQLTLIQSLKAMMKKDGVIILSSPARPLFLWTRYHYHEVSPDRLERWLLEPTGLKIVRRKKIRIPHSFGFYFKGFRAFMRLFYNFTQVYEIRQSP